MKGSLEIYKVKKQSIQAVILAGGEGMRLRPLTYKIPKPMVPINGRPFLWHQLKLIKSHGVTDVLILAGYLGKQIEDYFGNGFRLGLNIDYSYEEGLLGTGGALKRAENKLQEAFVLLNGDTYLSIDYKKVMDYFHQHRKIEAITVYNNSDKIAPNNVKIIEESNLVTGYSKKNNKDMNCLDAGLMVFKKKIVTFIKKNKKTSLEEEIFPKLIKIKELIAYPTSQKFYDIGSFQGLKFLREMLK